MKEAWLERWLGVAAVALIVVGIVVLVASALGVGDGPVQAYPFTGMMGGGGAAGGMMGGGGAAGGMMGGGGAAGGMMGGW